MKCKMHSPDQIIKKLKKADAMIALGKTHGRFAQFLEISGQTFHRWQSQHGRMKVEEARRPKELKLESIRITNSAV